jgi:hypothetical protein
MLVGAPCKLPETACENKNPASSQKPNEPNVKRTAGFTGEISRDKSLLADSRSFTFQNG